MKSVKYFLTRIPDNLYCFFYSFTITYVSFINGLQGDTLFHLKIGDFVLKNGIPRVDSFSWTTFGKPWFAHEWFWDLLIAKLFVWFGFAGIFLLHFFSVSLLVFFSYYLIKNRFYFFIGFLLLVNTIYIPGFYSLRPQTFIYGLFAFFLYLVTNRDKFKQYSFFLYLFFIFLIWTNSHSSVVLALGFLMILTFFHKTSWLDLLVALIASLCNPHGWKLFSFAFTLSSLSTTADRITEWFSPNFHYLPTLIIFLFILFILVVTSIQFQNNKKLLVNILLIFVAISLYLKSFRHLPFLLLTIIFAGQHDYKVEKWVSSSILILLISISFLFVEPFGWSKITAFDLSKEFPVEAVSFMKRNGYTDFIFNEYHYGNYLLYSDIKTFVDGRGDLFALENPTLWEDYFSFKGLLTEYPEEILRKYKIKYVLFPKESSCIKYLRKIDSWKVLFEDKKDVVMGYVDGK